MTHSRPQGSYPFDSVGCPRNVALGSNNQHLSCLEQSLCASSGEFLSASRDSTQCSQQKTKHWNLTVVATYEEIRINVPSAECDEADKEIKQASVVCRDDQSPVDVWIDIAFLNFQLGN